METKETTENVTPKLTRTGKPVYKSNLQKTTHEGVLLLKGADGKKTFYIRYRTPDKEQHYEKAMVEVKGVLIPAKNLTEATGVRDRKMKGNAPPNKVRRQDEKARREEEKGRMTISRIWAAWMEDPDHKDKGGTAKANNLFQKHLAGPVGSKTPDEITSLDVDRIRLELVKTDHAAATTDKVIKRLKAIVNYGNEKKQTPLLSFRIVTRDKKMGRPPKDMRPPNPRELAAILQVCKTWPDREVADFMVFMAYTGMRRGTAWNLRWEHLDLENATAYVPTKTGQKKIVLSSAAVEFLKNRPRDPESRYVFTGWGQENYKDEEGNPRRTDMKKLPRLTTNQACQQPRKILDAAGIPPGAFAPCHGFRHGLATTLDEQGASLKEIMGLGGWENPDMVLRYTNPTRKTLRSAADIMGKAIGKALGETG